MEESSSKQWHARAFQVSKLKPFEPYCLRHTFGTRMALKCDVFALAGIMGHSSIAITQENLGSKGNGLYRITIYTMHGARVRSGFEWCRQRLAATLSKR